MFVEPADLAHRSLLNAVSSGWGFPGVRCEYRAVGFGSHHYVLTAQDGGRHFVTVDDLRHGDLAPAAAARQLARALGTAMELATAGLSFVLAPLPRRDGAGPHGAVLARLDDFAVSVFPYVEGRAGSFGLQGDPETRQRVLALLGRLHSTSISTSTSTSTSTTATATAGGPPTDRLEIPARAVLLTAVADLYRPWTSGPRAESARIALAGVIPQLDAALAEYDLLRDAVTRRGAPSVITHGEPHPGNVLRTPDDDLLLIDWDTVALGPAERDLWMLGELTSDDLDVYRNAGGVATVDREALALFRRRWSLTEICHYTERFRAPHTDTADTRTAWAGFAAEIARLRPGSGPTRSPAP